MEAAIEMLTSKDLSMLGGGRLVGRLWAYYEKNDEKTIKSLLKANVGNQEQCENLLELGKKVINTFGDQF